MLIKKTNKSYKLTEYMKTPKQCHLAKPSKIEIAPNNLRELLVTSNHIHPKITTLKTYICMTSLPNNKLQRLTTHNIVHDIPTKQ